MMKLWFSKINNYLKPFYYYIKFVLDSETQIKLDKNLSKKQIHIENHYYYYIRVLLENKTHVKI